MSGAASISWKGCGPDEAASESEVMAKITYHPAVKHMHGGMGHMVFKSRDGMDLVAAKPDQVNQPNTPAQQQQKERFSQGARYAKSIMADPAAKAPYKAKAKEVHKPTFSLIVGDFLTPPVVEAIDVSGYHKHVGDPILIKAHDDFEVTGVTVSIVDNTQAPVETGTATFDVGLNAWRYLATADASAKPNVTVTANAQDRPGHAGTLSATA
jgi:hypothetical protein